MLLHPDDFLLKVVAREGLEGEEKSEVVGKFGGPCRG